MHYKTTGSGRLDIVQRWFQAVITHPGGVSEGIDSSAAQQLIRLPRHQLEQVVLRSKNLTANERITIYANAYYARLVECLSECFPVFKRTMGEEVFNGFAFEYLQRYPSGSYTLDRLADYFAQFLEETRPNRTDNGERSVEADWPDFLVDLATLEWTIGKVFDGPGVEGKPTLTPEDLHATPPERFAEAKLMPVICLRLLTFRYPVNAFYTMARLASDDEELAIPEPSIENVAISRREYIVRRYPLTPPQKVLLEVLQAGRTVGEAIAAAAEMSDDDDDEFALDLQSWFHLWTRERFFQSIALPH